MLKQNKIRHAVLLIKRIFSCSGFYASMNTLLHLAIGAGIFMTAGDLLAQNFPTKPIRWILPFGPGGVGDITSRAVAQKMTESMGQTILIDNRPSAGGIVAAEMVAKAEPDGYTLMLMNNTNAVSAAMFKSLPYDTIKDFSNVTTIGAFSLGLLMAPESGVKTTQELIRLFKTNPGKMNVGTINIGTTQFLASELFKSMAHLDLTTIPYNNTASVITALRGGGIQVAFEFLPPILGQIKSGALRAIAVSSTSRFAPLPNVPTLDESGLPGYDVMSWNGVSLPANTPQLIIDKLNKEVTLAVNSPSIKQRFQDLGVEPRLSTPQAMLQMLKEEISKWTALIDKANIKRQ